VALGQVLLSRANLLILDEPTNHLDFASVEALTQALMTFEGAFVVVSHDRSFIRRVGTQILEVSKGRLRSYPGTYEEYVWSVARGVYAEIQTDDSPTQKTAPSRDSHQNSTFSRNDRSKQLQSLERSIQKIETQLAKLDLELEALVSKADFEEWSELNQKKSDLESQWESLMQERDRLNNP
jgi:ATP-binding cassette subfamily F protein 3